MSSRLPAKGFILPLVLVMVLWSSAAPADAHTTGPAARPSTPVYEVQRGDVLSGLATRFGTTVKEIVALNGLRNADRIYAGRRLLLPGRASQTTSVATADTSGNQGVAGARHLVVAGDTLGGIARRYGIPTANLADWNGVTNDVIYAGTSLVLYNPGSRPSETPACPVPGAKFANDWGFPRSNGRVHVGTDLFAPRGTPFRAPVSGSVAIGQGPLGGRQVWLTDSGGNRWLGSHLDAFGASGWVSRGDVIGYVGDSGNARGSSPHLHLEFHPVGRGPVNLYPVLRQAC